MQKCVETSKNKHRSLKYIGKEGSISFFEGLDGSLIWRGDYVDEKKEEIYGDPAEGLK